MIGIVLLSGCGEGTREAEPGIYINEFLASNSNVLAEPLNNKQSDWIELYNAHDSVWDVSGYYLTDKATDTTKYALPTGTLIPAKGYLLVWADGVDSVLHTNFKLSRDGGGIALFSPEKKLLDQLIYGNQTFDVSRGRKWDGVDSWVYFDEPSPRSSNNAAVGEESLIFSDSPEFSQPAGFYPKHQKIELSAQMGEIRYTLDGSRPTRNSPVYTSPLKIWLTTVVRAVCIEKGKLASQPITQTYFIKVNKEIPVISLVADSMALWDSATGIYANSLRGIDRLGNIEFFEKDSSVINQMVDVSLSGNVARFHGQKAFLVEAVAKYGKPTFEYQVFPNKRVYSFESILLRAGGHPDKYETMIRDGMGSYLTEAHTNLDHAAYRPAVVYLNGKYWGVYNIREKTNAGFLASNHQLDKDQFDMLQDFWGKVKQGNRDHYAVNKKFLIECEKTEENYARIAAAFDLDNFIDYFICEIYAANVDWPAWNIKYWREKNEGAKWKWILVDLDYAFDMGVRADYSMIDFVTSPVKTKATNVPGATVVLRKLLEFPAFRDAFIQRMAVSLNLMYAPDRVLGIIQEFKEEKASEMPKYLKRWKGSVYDSKWGKLTLPGTVEKWNEKMDRLTQFVSARPDFIRKNMVDHFHLTGMASLTTKSAGGQIEINTLMVEEGECTGTYFKDVPMKLVPISAPGHAFVHWLIDGKVDTTRALEYIPRAEATIEAVFVKNSHTQLPCLIAGNMTLSAAKSPYFATCDVVVEKGATLTVEEGVQIFMEKHRSLLVYGGLKCNGTAEAPITIQPNPTTQAAQWGGLCLDHPTGKVELNHVNLLKGSWYEDRFKYKATLTAYHADVALDHVTVESAFFPFYSEYGKVYIGHSQLFSSKTCDFINVKYATEALVEGCELAGNTSPDTDGIDFDQIEKGTIRNNTIYGFFGSNSDAIDIGEGSSDILIEGNRIYNITDKGVSIGQGGSALIRNNLFSGCNMGVGIKDQNSTAHIESNTFYGNTYGVAVFEKNENAGAGSAVIQYCVFAKSAKTSILAEPSKNVEISHCLSSQNRFLGYGNVKIDPRFEAPLNYQFKLLPDSYAWEMSPNMGTEVSLPRRASTLEILFLGKKVHHQKGKAALCEIELKNASAEDIDLSRWTLLNESHHRFAFPIGLVLKKGETLFLTNNMFRLVKKKPEITLVRDGINSKLLMKGKQLRLYDEKMNLITSWQAAKPQPNPNL